jgi:hypothetical protein
MQLDGMICFTEIPVSVIKLHHFKNFIAVIIKKISGRREETMMAVVRIVIRESRTHKPVEQRMGMVFEQQKGTMLIINTLEIVGKMNPRPFYWNNL